MNHCIIIGSAKSGTTSLYNWLTKSPHIIGCTSNKEPRYFSGPFGSKQNYSEYLSLFSPPKTSEETTTLEASTTYTKYPQFPSAANFIHLAIPSTKLIYIVRNPLDRLRSHYNYVYCNPAATNKYLQNNSAPPPIRECVELAAISDYSLQLSFYKQLFSRDQLFLLDFEELTLSPASAIRKVLAFLKIDQMPKCVFTPHNVTDDDTWTSLDHLKRSHAAKILSNIVPLSVKKKVKTLEGRLFSQRKASELPFFVKSLSTSDNSFYMDLFAPSMARFRNDFGFPVEKWGF